MPPEKDDASYLWDMLDAAKAVAEFVSSRTYHSYQNDRMLRSAVERQIEIIGEAAGRVSRTFRDAHPEIPWQKIISQRHVIAHEYGELENELMWKLVTSAVPELIGKLENLIPPPPPVNEL